jgi:hypothetical protein
LLSSRLFRALNGKGKGRKGGVEPSTAIGERDQTEEGHGLTLLYVPLQLW